MSVNPRSYRVPVLRLTDVYQGESVNDDPGSNDIIEPASPSSSQPTQGQPAQTQTLHSALADFVPEDSVSVQHTQDKDEYVGEPVPKFDTNITYTPTAPKPPVLPPTQPNPVPVASHTDAPLHTVITPIQQPQKYSGGVSPWTLNPAPDRPDTLVQMPIVEPPPPLPPQVPKPITAPLKKTDDPLKAPVRPDLPDMWEAAASKPAPAPVSQKAPVHAAPEKSVKSNVVQNLINQTLAGMGVGGNPASSVSAPGGGNLDSLRARISNAHAQGQQPSTSVLQQSVPETPHVPETEHAKVLANVAHTLHTIHDSTKLLPDMQGDSDTGPASSEYTLVSVPPVRHADFLEEELIVTPAQKERPSSPVPMIRTFKADVEHAITHNKMSVVRMIADEEQKRYKPKERTEVRHTKKRHINVRVYALVLGSLGLLILTIALGFFIANLILDKEKKETTSEIFFSDTGQEFDLTKKDRAAVIKGLTDLRDTLDLNVGETAEVRIIERVVHPNTQEEQKVPITASVFLARINARAPDFLLRTLHDSFIFGVHRDQTGKRNPFFIFKVRTFGIAFPGMLEWEGGLDVDLAPLFGTPVDRALLERAILQAPHVITATSSEMPTLQTSIDLDQIGLYDDIDVANQATRVLRNLDMEIQLLWTIVPGENLLIITTTPDTFREILKRM